MEIWKEIEGYEGLYEVSNKGRVKSLAKDIEYSNGAIHHYPEIIRELQVMKNGYVYVGLRSRDKVTKTIRVHRIVATAFIPNPNNLPTVNHIDFNKENNSVENLEWADLRRQNQHSATKPNRRWQSHRKGMSGRLNFKSKPVVQIDTNGNIVNRFESGCLAAKSISGNQSKISKCCLGERRTHRGFAWRYEELNK